MDRNSFRIVSGCSGDYCIFLSVTLHRSYSGNGINDGCSMKFFQNLKDISSWHMSMNSPNRSSHCRCSIKKGVLKTFAKFTGKHLCWSLFLTKFIKKETLAQLFSCKFCENSKKHHIYKTPPGD